MRLNRRHRSRSYARSTRALETGAIAVGGAATFVAVLPWLPARIFATLFSLVALVVVSRRPRVRTSKFPLRDAALAALGSAAAVGIAALPMGPTRWIVSLAVAAGVLYHVRGRVRLANLGGVIGGWSVLALLTPSDVWSAALAATTLCLVSRFVSPPRSTSSRTSAPGDVQSSLLRHARMSGSVPTLAEERMARDAGRAVRHSLHRTLAMLRAALRGQSAVALWVDSRAASVRIEAAETSIGGLRRGPYSDRAGVLALLHGRSEAIVLNDLDRVDGFLPYNPPGATTDHVIGTALYEEGLLVGYLLVDRGPEQPAFDDVDAIALDAAAEQVVGAIHTERLVVDASRSRYEMGVLYRAADALNAALTVEDVCHVAREQLGHIAAMDLFAVTQMQDNGRQHVIYADGYGADELEDHFFEDDRSLASLAVRRAQPLPYSGRLDRPDSAILGDGHTLPELRSLLVFPLIMGPRCVGTLSIGSLDADQYDAHQREHLRIITSYVGAAIANAFAYTDAVVRATVDGMTGLTNHRTFKERGAEALARAERSGRPASLIITDIDHFKKVNDTYGHQAGDEVIIAVASVLKDTLRKVDLGARYGGEEFAVLLEETDSDSAVALAERIRTAVKDLRFTHQGETFSVTISLGVATVPNDATELLALVETADRALYSAKRGGRDQVRAAAREANDFRAA